MASAPSPSSSLLAAASPPSTSTPSSPAPMASRPNATPADSTTPPASSPAAPSPPTPPPPATATPPPVAPPKPSPSPPPPHVSAPAPARHPPPTAAAPPVVHSPPPTSATPPKSSPSHPRPPSPRPPAAPTGSPPLASPPSGHPSNHSPPSVVTSAPRSPRPSLPTPATAADPARQSSTKSSSPGVRHRSSSSDGGLSTGAMVIIGAVLAILVLSLVGAAVWYTKKRKRARDGYHAGFMISSPFMSLHPSGDSSSARFPFAPAVQTSYSNGSPRLKEPIQTNYSTGSPRLKESLSDLSMANSRFFTYEELYQITNGFSTQNLLGEGGFGSVYKGCLRDGRVVAIKRLKDGGGQGEREFHAEVEIISRVHHRHLVSLVGYCISDDQRLLVYDFVPNNTLHYHLHGHGRPVLEWPARVKIAAGAARGIAYLHEDCHPRIIHRDIKSSNILLDNNFEAQVADFGLARLALDAVTHVTTRVMGTFGYLAPEYASSGKLTERSDVFSFGVVLLELITGRKPVDASRPLGDESLVEWARPLLTQAIETGDLEELLDPRLKKNFNEVEMFRMIEAAAACIRHSASRRPRMSQVVRVLDSLADIDLTNGVQPGKSELFNVANTADIRLFQQMVLFGSQDHSSDFSQSSWNSRGRDIGSASGSRLL